MRIDHSKARPPQWEIKEELMKLAKALREKADTYECLANELQPMSFKAEDALYKALLKTVLGDIQ